MTGYDARPRELAVGRLVCSVGREGSDVVLVAEWVGDGWALLYGVRDAEVFALPNEYQLSASAMRALDACAGRRAML